MKVLTADLERVLVLHYTHAAKVRSISATLLDQSSTHPHDPSSADSGGVWKVLLILSH